MDMVEAREMRNSFSLQVHGAKQLLTTFGMLLGCIGMNLL